jgi:hypothetical protein
MIWCLLALVGLGVFGVVWAVLTGGPAGDPRPVRVPLHSRKLAEDTTHRLAPGPTADWSQIPPLPDSPLQRLVMPLDMDYTEVETRD